MKCNEQLLQIPGQNYAEHWPTGEAIDVSGFVEDVCQQSGGPLTGPFCRRAVDRQQHGRPAGVSESQPAVLPNSSLPATDPEELWGQVVLYRPCRLCFNAPFVWEPRRHHDTTWPQPHFVVS